MRLVGLLGGVASGKSLVARLLSERGACVLDADRGVHEVLRTPEIKEAAGRRWGRGVFGPDGEIDRKELARIVFAPAPEGRQELTYLEQLVHPATARRLRQDAERHYASGCKLAVLDAPLLLEAGWDKFCDSVLFVEAPRQLRQERARQRGWSEMEFAAREGAQESLDLKRRAADAVVDNSGSPEQTRAQIDRIWAGLVG